MSNIEFSKKVFIGHRDAVQIDGMNITTGREYAARVQLDDVASRSLVEDGINETVTESIIDKFNKFAVTRNKLKIDDVEVNMALTSLVLTSDNHSSIRWIEF